MPEPSLLLPESARHVLISVNPKAGRRSVSGRVERLFRSLNDAGFEVEASTDLAEVTGRANELHRQGRLRALVGAGGDGTAAELTNRTDVGVPITLLAAGTANLLAKHFGLSSRPEALCRAIASGRLQQLDAGRANGRLFLVMIGCGFDAEVVRQVHRHRLASVRGGGHIGYTTYFKPIWRSIRSYRYPELQVYFGGTDGQAEEPQRVHWAFACNLPRYGWGIPLAPGAEGDDGRLDVCTYHGSSLLRGIAFAAAAQFGAWHQRLPGCRMSRAARLRITSDQPAAYQLDGDPGGDLPVEVEVLPKRLTLLVPSVG
ncbi:MAG: diacylglycerol/lipid kinase family protein [Thermoguttaceae bacterium]